jgi:hypothetical protein
MLTYAKYDILKSILKFEIQIKIAFHFYVQLAFLTKPPKSAIFGVLSAFVKDSRPFKQREKRLLKVVTVNLPLYKH